MDPSMNRRGGARRWTVLLLAVALGVGQGRAQIAQELVVVDGIAARVNEHVITIGEVMAAMDPARRALLRDYAGDALETRLRQAYRETLDTLMERYLVLDEYHASGAKLPEWVVDSRIEEMIKEMFGDRAKLMDALAEERITYQDWRSRMRDQMIVSSMRRSKIDQNLALPAEEVRRYYDEHPEEFSQPLRLRLRMIMIQPRKGETEAATRERAAAAYVRLQAGEDFADVARDVSDDSKAAEGGDWGWVKPGLLRAELAEAAAALTPGATAEPLQVEGIDYLLKVEEREEARLPSYEEAQPAIERKLRQAKSEVQYAEWIQRLRAKAYINISDINLFAAEQP